MTETIETKNSFDDCVSILRTKFNLICKLIGIHDFKRKTDYWTKFEYEVIKPIKIKLFGEEPKYQWTNSNSWSGPFGFDFKKEYYSDFVAEFVKKIWENFQKKKEETKMFEYLNDFMRCGEIYRKIVAIGYDHKISEDDSYTLGYYHLTLNNFYNSSNDEQIQMIKLILDIEPINPDWPEELIDGINQMKITFKEMNKILRERGIENSTEMVYRKKLKFHEDLEYRNKIINLYDSIIKPNYDLYTEDKIQLSFQKHQKELEEFDNILNEALK